MMTFAKNSPGGGGVFYVSYSIRWSFLRGELPQVRFFCDVASVTRGSTKLFSISQRQRKAVSAHRPAAKCLRSKRNIAPAAAMLCTSSNPDAGLAKLERFVSVNPNHTKMTTLDLFRVFRCPSSCLALRWPRDALCQKETKTFVKTRTKIQGRMAKAHTKTKTAWKTA